jgi:hypothetical protein
MGLKHAFSSSKADGADATLVQPSSWNADHTFSGGSSGSVLYVSGGNIQTTGSLVFDPAVNELEILGAHAGICLAPLTGTEAKSPEADEGIIFLRKRAGRILPNFLGPSGIDWAFQPHLGMNRVFAVYANGNATSYDTFGGAAATASGTAAAANWASTNISSTLRRVDHPSGLTVGASAGLRGAAAFYSIGNFPETGGFYMLSRYIVALTATSNTRLFCGFTGSTSNPATANPSAGLNLIAVAKDAADTTYQFMVNDGTSTATKTNTGITMTQGDVCESRIFVPPSGSTVYMSHEVLSVGGTGTWGTGPLAEMSATTDLPSNTTALNWHCYLQTATTTAVRLGVCSIYIETDN